MSRPDPFGPKMLIQRDLPLEYLQLPPFSRKLQNSDSKWCHRDREGPRFGARLGSPPSSRASRTKTGLAHQPVDQSTRLIPLSIAELKPVLLHPKNLSFLHKWTNRGSGKWLGPTENGKINRNSGQNHSTIPLNVTQWGPCTLYLMPGNSWVPFSQSCLHIFGHSGWKHHIFQPCDF